MRRSISRKRSKRLFKRSSGKTRVINLRPRVMRGGFRL